MGSRNGESECPVRLQLNLNRTVALQSTAERREATQATAMAAMPTMLRSPPAKANPKCCSAVPVGSGEGARCRSAVPVGSGEGARYRSAVSVGSQEGARCHSAVPVGSQEGAHCHSAVPAGRHDGHAHKLSPGCAQGCSLL